jgi:riboflavin biosynthesis pyrimidine reductase
VSCGEAQVDLQVAVDVLAERGHERVLCEGGPTLLRALLIAGLVDELCLTIAPLLAGSDHHHLAGHEPLPVPADFALTHLTESDGMLLTSYAWRPPA